MQSTDVIWEFITGAIEVVVVRSLRWGWRALKFIPTIPQRVRNRYAWRRWRPMVSAPEKLRTQHTDTPMTPEERAARRISVFVPVVLAGRFPHRASVLDFSKSTFEITQRAGPVRQSYVFEFVESMLLTQGRLILDRGEEHDTVIKYSWPLSQQSKKAPPNLDREFSWKIDSIWGEFEGTFCRKLPPLKGRREAPYS